MSRAELEERASEIENSVASNDLNAATKRLMDFCVDFSQDKKDKRESINIRAEYTELREDSRTLGKTDLVNERFAKLRRDILDFIDQIKEEYEQVINPSRRDVSTEVEEVVETETSKATMLPSLHDSSESKDLSKILDNPEEKISSNPNTPMTDLQRAKQKFLDARKQHPPESVDISEDRDIVFAGIEITKSYKSRAVKFKLNPIDLTLKRGEITTIVGENGNGKTTLLRIIAGELKNSMGKLGYPGLTLDGRKDWYSIKQQIAYIPQQIEKWNGLLMDNLHFAASIHGITGDDNQDQVDFIISRLGLEQYRKATWDEISGGYRTRFELAKALVWTPKLIILDEPLANLDINTQILFLQDLRDLANSSANPLSVIVSSQHLYEVENIADNIIFLKGGSAVYNGSVADFGEDRKENSYEIASNLPKDELLDLLETFSYHRIDQEGKSFVIHTDRNIKAHDLLKIFINHNISLKYFRDISKSTRKLFEEKRFEDK